jgi:predicted nucleotidyltransferase
VNRDVVPHLTSDESEAVNQYINRIQSRFGDRIITAVLFGSKARGDADDESDIDLLLVVDSEDRALRNELWRIAFRVSLEHNLVISPSVFGQASWAETRRIRMPLYRAVEADGIPLTLIVQIEILTIHWLVLFATASVIRISTTGRPVWNPGSWNGAR